MSSEKEISTDYAVNKSSDFEKGNDVTTQGKHTDKKSFCDPCKKDSKCQTAEGFCLDCGEYLCSSCLNVHKKLRITQNHVLLDNKSMPEKRPADLVTAKDICVDKCPSHTDKVIEYFCQSCDKLCCSVCIIKGHRPCETVDFIPDIVENIEQSEAFLHVNKAIEEQSRLLTEQSNRCNVNQYISRKLRDSAKEDVNMKCQDIHNWLDKKEKEMCMKIESKYTEEQQRFDTVSKEVTNLQDTLQYIKSSLSSRKTPSQRCQLFVALQKAKLTTKYLQTRLQELDKVRTIKNYCFKEASCLQEVTKQTDMGTLEEMKSEKKKIKVQLLYTIDTCHGYPGSICIMSDNILLLKGSSIMTFNINRKQGKFMFKLALQSRPADITKVSETEAAITFPDDGVVQFFYVTPEGQIKDKQKMQVGKGCVGIQFFKNTFIIAYCHNQSGCIKIVNMSGQLVKELAGSSPLMFQSPRGLALNPKSEILYVSDSSNCTVTSLTLDGSIINTFKDEIGIRFYGVSVDENGSVYVCDCCQAVIFQLSETCSLVKHWESSTSKSALHIAFSDTNNLMCVSTYFEGIRVFEII